MSRPCKKLVDPSKVKVIFLDIDGVLNTPETYQKWKPLGHGDDLDPFNLSDDRQLIDSDKLDLLNCLVAETGAVVVISSSWRFWPWRGVKYFRELLNSPDDPDFITVKGVTNPALSRYSAIWDWLYENPDVVDYVILDDEDQEEEGFEWRLANHILTITKIGLTQDQMWQAVDILNGHEVW